MPNQYWPQALRKSFKHIYIDNKNSYGWVTVTNRLCTHPVISLESNSVQALQKS